MALLEFYGEECSHCQTMRPLVERLEKEGFKVEKYETWHDAENKLKLWDLDKGYCDGVPFFINTDSNKFICGEAGYEDLRSWAEGKFGEDATPRPPLTAKPA